MSVLVQRRHAQHVVAIASLAGVHDAAVTLPMALAQPLRNDEIERAAERFCFRVAENSPGGGVPENDGPVSVGRDDCVAGNAQELRGVEMNCHEEKSALSTFDRGYGGKCRLVPAR